jgi:hypothetical protein
MRRIAKVMFLMIVVVLAVVLDQPASAAPANYMRYTSARVNCASQTLSYNLEYSLQVGSRYTSNYEVHSARFGDQSLGGEWLITSPRSGPQIVSGGSMVSDGWIRLSLKVYNPDGTLSTTSSAYFECPAGIATVQYYDGTPGILPPDPAHRVMGTVLHDTPVYSEPGPDYSLKDTLKAGQTWFVVSATTGTDGKQWYEVFVGGVNNAWVPASAIQLQGATAP